FDIYFDDIDFRRVGRFSAIARSRDMFTTSQNNRLAFKTLQNPSIAENRTVMMSKSLCEKSFCFWRRRHQTPTCSNLGLRRQGARKKLAIFLRIYIFVNSKQLSCVSIGGDSLSRVLADTPLFVCSNCNYKRGESKQ